jgi:CelD/BcsL family acetyltransferase involved in cellulose biosynthesis
MRENLELNRSICRVKTDADPRLDILHESSDAAARIIWGRDGLDAVAKTWESLEGQFTMPTQQYIWARTCAATVSLDSELCVVGARTGGQVVAIAALVRHPSRACRLELLGVKETHEPTDLLYSNASSLTILARTLAQLRFPLLLGRLPADSPTLAAIRDAYRGRGLVISRPAHGYPRILLDAGWKDPEQRLNPGRRSDLRRARRIAEKMGPVTCEVLSPTPGELEQLLEEALLVEADGWKGRQGGAMACNQRLGLFYRQYAAVACEKGILRLCFLRVGGQAVAMQFAVESGGGFWLLKIGYREEFARCSPGMLLMLETLRYAAARGLSSFEFLGTVEPWTTMWTTHVRPCVLVRVYPAGLRGMLALLADAGHWGRRRIGRPSR